jgi:hypothetical protein
MLDQIMTATARFRHPEINYDYTPEQAVVSSKLINEDAEQLAVVLPPWHGWGLVDGVIEERLEALGFAVLSYELHDEILMPHTANVKHSFRNIKQRIETDVHELDEQKQYKKKTGVAASLGTPALAMTADLFERAILITPGSSLVKCVMDGIRTRHIKKGILKSGDSVDHVSEQWQDMTPADQVDALAGKEVDVVISRNDPIIPSRYQFEYLEALKTVTDPNVFISRLGHYGTIGKFCLRGALSI